MKPPPFLYERPETLDEAVGLLAEHGDEAKILAGGQSLVPVLNFRLLRPSVLVDVNQIESLATRDGDTVGATVRQRDFGGHPLVDLALPYVGHYVTRNRGTVGGSVAHADASAELPLCLVALGGTIETSHGRCIAADDFFVSHFMTTLEPDELLVSTTWPRAGSVGFSEHALRHGDFALAVCACAVTVENGAFASARVGVGAVVDRPSLLDLQLAGAPATSETAREAGARAATLVDPPGNLHASGAYLRHLTSVVVTRALEATL
ncbi:MAG: FAD binding domain-containing protein [Actinomycetota bacterium]